MDAELKAYLDGMVDTISRNVDRSIGRLEQRLDGLEQRLDGLEERMDALEQRMVGLEQGVASLRVEMNEKFIAIDERLRTMELRIEHFETRVNDRLSSVEVGVARLVERTTALEQQLVELNTRVDGLAADNRQRFRVLTDRLAGIERLVA